MESPSFIMRILIQRVRNASVTIKERVAGAIERGFLILVGVADSDTDADADADADTDADADWLCAKVAAMRLFSDDAGKMNLSLADIDGEVLVVSQFTLHASTRKGNRPSFIRAAKSEIAVPLYQRFIDRLSQLTGKPIQTGEFGAMMRVQSVNDGPVTVWVDSKNRE